MNTPDNQEPTYGRRKRTVPHQHALLSLVRTQKLDLLVHLLANLQKPLIVTGPKGIGKTTLAQTFCANHRDDWFVHLIDVSGHSRFEQITEQLAQLLDLRGPSTLSMLRNFCTQNKVILILDDADQLLPGLIDELVQFAESLPKLRLVFLISQEALAAKYSSDATLSRSQVIDLPPLTIKQTHQYLHYLAKQPDAVLDANMIDDELLLRVHQKTGGIPGAITTELPIVLQKTVKAQTNSRLLVIAVLAAGLAWAGYQWLLPEPVVVEKPTATAPEALAALPEPILPVPAESSIVPPVSSQPLNAVPAPESDQQAVVTLPVAPEIKIVNEEPPVVKLQAKRDEPVQPAIKQESKPETKPAPAQEVTAVKSDVKKPELVTEVKPEPKKPEVVAEVKPEPKKPEVVAEVKPEPKKPEVVAEVKPEPKKPEAVVEVKPEPKKPEAVVEVKPEPKKPEAVVEVKPDPKKPEVVAEVKLEPKKPEAVVEVKLDPKKPEVVAEVKPEPKKPEAVAEVKPETKPVATPTNIEPKPESKPSSSVPVAPTPLGAADWINGQSPNRYTLQVMVLSTQQAAERFLRKYAEYGDALNYYSSGSRYVIVYGSFESSAEAQAFKANMPREFSQSMVKNFKSIQSATRH